MNRKLGYGSGERLLIINADDFGITKGTNQAIINLFRQSAITSTSIMMPCSAARDAAVLGIQQNVSSVGIHLTLTSDKSYPYRPVFQQWNLESLTTEDGYFHHEASYIEEHADPDEVRMELAAQILSAIRLGIDPTHLDSHAGSIMGITCGRDFLEIAFDLCDTYGLPFLLPLQIVKQPFFSSSQKELFQKRIDSAKSRGILLIDDLVSLPYRLNASEGYEELKRQLIMILQNLKPGITQLTTHPSMITDEHEVLTQLYREREMEYRLLSDLEIKQLLRSEGIHCVSWKDIRDLQRS